MTIDRITRELDFPFPPERVWRAVTRPEEISRWFSDHVTMTLAVGGEMELIWNDYGTTTGIVETVEPVSHFAFRWRAHSVSEEVPMDKNNSTLVTFLLSPTDSGTRLQVIESGFAALAPTLREKAYRDNDGGWTVELGELVTYLKG